MARRKPLRIALLSTLEPAGAVGAPPRAFLEVGGLSVARQQLGLALALDCERIVCLAHAIGPELLELQRIAEARKAQFHAITATRGLTALVSAADELIVLADGLMVEPKAALELLSAGATVLAQPIESGLLAGFERIDLNSASGGAMRIPGRLVDRLNELPPDVDAVSALTRIALQAGVPLRRIDQAGEGSKPWLLVRSEDEAHVTETSWLDQRLPRQGGATFSSWLARLAVRAAGPALLHMRGGLAAAWGGAGAMLVLALGSGWLGAPLGGLVLAAFGWILLEAAGMLGAVERQALLLPSPRFKTEELCALLFDILLISLATLGVEGRTPGALLAAAFAPAMVVALARIVPRAVSASWTGWLGDRVALPIVFGLAQISGHATYVYQGLAVLLAVGGLIRSRDKRG